MKIIELNEVQSAIILVIFLIGCFTSSWFIISGRLRCLIRGIIRSIKHWQWLDGHEYEELCTGEDYWEDKQNGILGGVLDYEVLVCKDCGRISISQNCSDDEFGN